MKTKAEVKLAIYGLRFFLALLDKRVTLLVCKNFHRVCKKEIRLVRYSNNVKSTVQDDYGCQRPTAVCRFSFFMMTNVWQSVHPKPYPASYK